MIERRFLLKAAGAMWLPSASSGEERNLVGAPAESGEIEGTQSPFRNVASERDEGLRDELAQPMPGKGAALIAWVRDRVGAQSRLVADVLDDEPSIMDFIPSQERAKVRDGTCRTDLSPYFQAAAKAVIPLVVPAGTYPLDGDVRFTEPVDFRAGAKLRRSGGKLTFLGGFVAPPGQQIFFGYLHSAIEVDNTRTPEGWADWFGRDADAIETCHKVFRVSRLGPHDYNVTRTVVLDQSYRQVLGAGGSAEGEGGTRIVLSGPAARTQPVVRLGTLNTSAVLSCARRLIVNGINTFRDGIGDAPASGRREDAVPGWLIAGWYESRMADCFDYGSGIHYRIYGTIGCTLSRCGGVRPQGGEPGTARDFYTAFCIGGYSTSFGFIGANASLTVEGCGTAGGSAGDPSRVGLYLFGYIGDTWIDKFEMSQLEYGIYVDGSDRSGNTVGSLSAHQDVRITNCVLDANLRNCITLRHLNDGCGLQARGNYAALNGAGDGILVEECTGLVTIDGGDMIANSTLANNGVRIVRSKRVQVNGVPCRDFRVGIRAEECGQLRLTPMVHRTVQGGTNAIELRAVARSYVAPIVDGPQGAWQCGISVDAGTNYSEFNLTGINFGAFERVNADQKLVFGQVAVTNESFGSGNVRSGVIG